MKTNLLKSLFISLIFVMGVSNAWAASEGSSWYDWASSENVYFDNTNSSYSNVSMLIGRQWNYGSDGVGSSGVNFTKVENTNNLYHAATTWNHYNTLLFMDETGWGWEGNKVTQRYTYAKNYTNTNNININGTELFYAASSSKGATLNHEDLSSYTALNYTQTVQQHLSTDGGSNYSTSTTALATVKVSSYKLKSTNATESSSGTIASGSSTTTCSAARTATVTYAVSGVKTGYTFVGWYDGTTQKSTATTYNALKATGTKTITARFKENTYSVTISAGSGGTVSPSGSKTIGQVTKTTVTATPDANYEFVNWTTTGGVVVANTSSASTTITATAAGTLTANFRSTATNSLTVAAGAGIASVKGSTDPVTLGSTYAITATPKTGYTFSTWTANPAENAAFGSETTANTTVTVKNGSVTVTASATENMSTLTTSNKYDAGDPGYEVPAASVNSIGYETTATITATTDDDYTLISWTLTNCTRTDGGADNATTITVRSNGDGKAAIVTANYTENPCVYFVNTARWTNVYIHTWVDGGDGTSWPGTPLSNKVETINGYDVYKYVRPSEKSYNKVIFHNNASTQTADLEWENGKYYIYYTNTWVDKAEIENHLPSTTIYFKNNPKWTKVYVYFLTGENYGDLGASSSGLTEANKRCCAMTQIGTTDVWKYDYGASGVVPGNVIAFTEAKQPNHGNFYNTKAAYRTDFNSGMELFIPQEASSETKNGTKYYNKGLWMKYNSTESGYTITGDFNSWNQESDKFTSETSGGYIFQKELLLSSGNTYEFKIKNIKNDWFRTSTAITSTKNTDIEFTAGDGNNVTITALSDGYYIFSIDLSTGKMLVSVEYPLMVGDYRMVYVENEVLGEKPYAKFHPAQSIRGITTGEKLDIVSFFINKTNGKNPAILLQRCSNINGATITWEDIAIQYINDISGANPAAALAPAKKSAELYIGDGCPAVTKDAVYNFVLEQTNTGSHKAQILAGNTHLYEGNYYIRTDGAAGGWSKYNTNPDNIMTHSQTALTHGGYDYYFCEWMLKGNNVKYVVANDYSYCVSDTLAKDDIVTDENGNLPADANVRYTWNSSTNALKRAYINGSGKIADRYLVLMGNEYLKDASGNVFPEGTGDRTGLKANETAFADMGNWLYQVDIKASENTLVKLSANYNGKIQYFKGAADATVPIITGAKNEYKFRLIYDFKTNYLLCGLTEDGEISENISVDEAVIMRSHHDQAQTFKVASGKSITTIKTIYGVMNFNKSTLNGAGSEHERALYWVSFPFDVDLGEAFGFGNYGEHWIMEYYDGEARAANGLWIDSDTYWEYIWNPKGYTLEAGKGYVLCLDLDLLKESASLWDNTDDIALYFPSKDENITIDDKPVLKDTDVKPLTCTIERDDRKTKDSNWNIIGVPAYTNFPDIDTKNIGFYYEYDKSHNRYAVNNAAVFDCMHAYMVQFAGRIEWAYARVAPESIAARRNAAGKDQYTLRLALQQEGADHDHTFIRLQEDNATAEFDMNYDLCKIINRGANIYSMINNVEVAANVLPVEERFIPIGLDIHETGNYTFAMPDGTDGITAILIDYETGKETNLLLADYTTELREGTNNERFVLRVRPNHVATAVETIIDGANGQIQKYIINGALYILNNGQLYDAQGRMVQP